jgi:enoyl-CoA hydratase/carnithine racemase
VITGSGKFFSNGLDLEFTGSLAPNDRRKFMQTTNDIFARIMCLNVPTVAAINGHAFGISFR